MYCKDICFLIVRKQDKSDLKKQKQRLLMKKYQLEHGIVQYKLPLVTSVYE